jgi:hypothetical protein
MPDVDVPGGHGGDPDGAIGRHALDVPRDDVPNPERDAEWITPLGL